MKIEIRYHPVPKIYAPYFPDVINTGGGTKQWRFDRQRSIYYAGGTTFIKELKKIVNYFVKMFQSMPVKTPHNHELMAHLAHDIISFYEHYDKFNFDPVFELMAGTITTNELIAQYFEDCKQV